MDTSEKACLDIENWFTENGGNGLSSLLTKKAICALETLGSFPHKGTPLWWSHSEYKNNVYSLKEKSEKGSSGQDSDESEEEKINLTGGI